MNGISPYTYRSTAAIEARIADLDREVGELRALLAIRKEREREIESKVRALFAELDGTPLTCKEVRTALDFGFGETWEALIRLQHQGILASRWRGRPGLTREFVLGAFRPAEPVTA